MKVKLNNSRPIAQQIRQQIETTRQIYSMQLIGIVYGYIVEAFLFQLTLILTDLYYTKHNIYSYTNHHSH